MPFKDRTGPEGKGPMTGRVSGYCAETDAQENITPQGRGSRRGRGAGRGFGRGRGAGRGLGRGRPGRGRGGSFFVTRVSFWPEQEIKEKT